MKLVLPFPPSMNRLWRTTIRAGFAHTYTSQEAKAYKELCFWTAKQQWAKVLTGDVIMRGTIYFPNKRGDLTNRIKILEDALEGACYENDRQVVRIDISRAIDKEDPRVELDISEAI